MTIRKHSVVLTADATVHLPDEAGELVAVGIKSSSDTGVTITLTDYFARQLFTITLGDFTTRAFRRTSPAETNIFDTGGDASADTEHSPAGLLFDGPVAVAFGGTLGSGEIVVDFYYRVIQKITVVADTLNTAPVINLPVEAAARLIGMAVVSSSDTTVAVTVTDGAPTARTVATWASADYTTRSLRHLADVETVFLDTGGDPSADTEGNDIGVLVEKSLTFTTSGLGAGTFTIDVYFEA